MKNFSTVMMIFPQMIGISVSGTGLFLAYDGVPMNLVFGFSLLLAISCLTLAYLVFKMDL